MKVKEKIIKFIYLRKLRLKPQSLSTLWNNKQLLNFFWWGCNFPDFSDRAMPPLLWAVTLAKLF